MKIGFIGFGEAAYNIAFGFGTEGLTGIKAFDVMADDPVMGKLVHKRAEEAKVELVKNAKEIAEWADVCFASVPSSFTLGVCEGICETLHAGQFYVDVSASTPAIKEKVWALIENTGVQFVDAAMLGSLPKKKHQVPITASGNGAAAFKELMTPYGMKITLAGDKAGAASAIKLMRSVFMKGIATLMIEMLEGAAKYGVADEVVASIGKSLDGTPFQEHLDRLVTGTGVHAKRRSAELKGSIEMLKDAGIAYDMTEASKHRMEALIDYKFAEMFIDAAPKKWQQIVDVTIKDK